MNSKELSHRARTISPFIVMEVLEKAQLMEAAGHEIIHLEIGEPDFPTPDPVTEAAMRALANNDGKYTHSLGKLSLREEICTWYLAKYGVSISPEQIIVTSGTSPGMLLAFSAVIEPGDEVILPDPYYACYPNFVQYLNARPFLVPVYEENGFKYRSEHLRQSINGRTRAIVLNSPANPTGAVSSGEEMRQLADLGQLVISDEIYNGLIYDGEEHSILEYTDNAIVINGFSKLFAMTGWRLGYVIAPREHIRAMQKIQQNLFICATSFVQEGGIAALRHCQPQVDTMVATYSERRHYVLKRLEEMGVGTRVQPTGAFYALANVAEYTADSFSFAFDILEKAHVAVTPGIDFGPHCEGYIRVSYANSLANLEEGLNRLERYLEECPRKDS